MNVKRKRKNYHFYKTKLKGTPDYPNRGEMIAKKYPHLRNWIVFAEKTIPQRYSYKDRCRYMYEMMKQIEVMTPARFVQMILPQYKDRVEYRKMNLTMIGGNSSLSLRHYDDILIAYGFFVRLRRVTKDAIIKMYRTDPDLKVIAKITKTGKWGVNGLT